MANLPNPVTRKEQYLSVMAKNTTQYPEEPITREEMYLDYLCKNGTGGGSGGTTNYNQLTNRPQINGNTLEGNLTAEDLGLQPENLVVTLTQNGESITADKSYADINQAYTDGKDIYAVIEGNIVPLYGKAGTTYIFQSVLGVQVTDFELNSENEWSVETINIIANSTRPGGIIADEKTDDDTVEVHVDSKTGKAYVNASQDTTTTPPIINTASGNPITLTDSSDNLFQGIEMDGKTEQVTTTGAQLLDTNQLTIGGINGGSGENYNTQSGIRTDAYIPVDAKCTYTLSGYSPYNFANGIVYDESKTKIGFLNSNIKIPEGGKYIRLSFSKNDQSNFTDDELEALKTTIMLNYGSAALPWEPYTGGSPSPSPDHPQPIINGGTYDEKSEKWEYEVGVGGAQLFDASKLQTKSAGGATVTNNGDGSFTVSGSGNLSSTFSVQYDYSHDETIALLQAGKEIRLNQTSPIVPTVVMQLRKNNANYKTVSTTGYTITEEDIQDQTFCVRLNIYGGSGSEIIPGTYKPMVYQDGNGTWEPYKHQSVTLTADRPLTKWDKLEKRNGQWGWVYKNMETTLDGSEKWGVYAGYEGFHVAYIFDTPRLRAEGFCESFICEQYNNGKDTALWLGVNNYSVYAIRIPQYNEELPDSGLQDWKDWLSENPITILTYADEEIFVPLSESEQEQMNALHTYRPTTVLTNQQGLDMTVDYIADTKTYIDNKFEALQQSLANTNAQLLGGN